MKTQDDGIVECCEGVRYALSELSLMVLNVVEDRTCKFGTGITLRIVGGKISLEWIRMTGNE